MTASATVMPHAEHDGSLAEGRRPGISNPFLGMILFICSEVMFFAGLFAAYFNVRATAPRWPPVPPEVSPELAERFNLHAEPWFAAILTIVAADLCGAAESP